MQTSVIVVATCIALSSVCARAQAPAPAGEIKGDAWVHTKESLVATVDQADVCLPAAATGGKLHFGKFKDLPKTHGSRVPVILFLHGSSGLGLKAIGEWQK
jgi:hypothetical protein